LLSDARIGVGDPEKNQNWQRNYYERIIRDEPALHQMRRYILQNLYAILGSLSLFLTAAPPTHAQDVDSLEADLPHLLASGHIPGLSIAVIRDGTLQWSGAFGVQSTATGAAVDPNTVFEAASLSKPVFAYAVLRMVDRGDFDLDTPLATYLPYERLVHEPRYRQITARMVMSHSTGLPNWGGDRLDLSFDPGTAWSYSGEGFVYLQKTLEHLTGMTLDEVVRREVFTPLGMTRSSYVWQDAFAGNAVDRHNAQGRAAPLRHAKEGNAAASLLTTATDYARFLNAVVNSEGVEAETVDRMLRPEMSVISSTWNSDLEAKEKIAWGLGWGLHPMEAGHAFWHWGDNGDSKAFSMTDYGSGIGFVFFANSDDGLSIVQAVADRVFGEPAWGIRWLGYEQHDDPGRRVRLHLQRAFVQEGIEAGTRRYFDLRTAQPDVVTESLVNTLGYNLLGMEAVEAAVAVFKLNVEAHPASANAYDSLGEAHLAAGAREPSLTSYRQSVALNPENENARQYIAWIEARMAVEANPVRVPAETLRGYVGDYGLRHIHLDDDTLYYRRDGNPRYRLIPLADDLFALDGLETFRIRFVADETGRITRLVGLYVNGNQDETRRDP